MPVPDVLRAPEHQVVLLVQAEQEGEVALPVRQTHPAHVTESDLDNDCLNLIDQSIKCLVLF